MEENSKRKLQLKWVSAIPIICTIVYFILAYCLDHFTDITHPYLLSLLVFLVVPFEYVIVGLKKFRIEYPVLIAIIYVVIGIVSSACGYPLWHPAWVLFLTIPIYYIFKDSKTVTVSTDKKEKTKLNEYGCDYDSGTK